MSEAHCAPLLISSADRSLHFGTHALFLTLHGVLLDGNVILSPALGLRGCSKIQRDIHYKETSLIKTLIIFSLIIYQYAVSGHILPSLQLAHLLHSAGNGIRSISCVVQHFVHRVQLVDDRGNFFSTSLQHLWTGLLFSVLFDN